MACTLVTKVNITRKVILFLSEVSCESYYIIAQRKNTHKIVYNDITVESRTTAMIFKMKLFGFPIFLLWTFLMKVMTKNVVCTDLFKITCIYHYKNINVYKKISWLSLWMVFFFKYLFHYKENFLVTKVKLAICFIFHFFYFYFVQMLVFSISKLSTNKRLYLHKIL